MPAHNSESTVGAAIRSTLRAMPPDSELIVFDDGSTDATATRINSINDKRVRVIIADSNIGVAAGLNRMLSSSDSEYVARMDADDICLPWRFSYSHKHLQSVDVLFTGVIHFGESIASIHMTDPTFIGSRAFSLSLVLENPFAHPTMYARRGVIQECGGYRGVLAEDYDLWNRLVAGGRSLVRLPAPTVLYRHHSSQVTRQNEWRKAALSQSEFGVGYRALSKSVLDLEPTWLEDLIEGPTATGDRQDAILGLREALLEQLPKLTPAERRNLRRRIAACL